MSQSSPTIVLGICGGIAAYKGCELTRQLVKAQYDVHVILTKAAEQFVTPLTLQTLSGNAVHHDLFSLTDEMTIGHITLADRAAAILVAPATANCLAKVAHGMCDDLLTTVICATRAPVAFAPSMNLHMWENRITQENARRLREAGYLIIPPTEGELACGYSGCGRLPDPATLVEQVNQLVK